MRTRNDRMALSFALLAILASDAATASPAAIGTHPATPGHGESSDEEVRDSPVPSEEATALETITVTGTRIKGGESPSPVITIGSERIREEGFADLGEVIRSVPQNFNGGQNPGVLSGGFSGAGFANANVTGGSSLNLRGLGPDATLTLLNGRRMAYSGFVQAVDIGAIPVEAVDRIEIVADGASAIYGSDAVGGVGNVILKRDFDGVAVDMRYGAATAGGMNTREYSSTAGTYWDGGGVIASYKDSTVDPIHASERRYADHLASPTTLYPGSGLRSGLFSGYQAFGDPVELRLDALWNRRDQLHYFHARGVNRVSPETTSSLVSPSVEFTLPSGWTASVAGTQARSIHNEYQTRIDPVTGTTSVVIDDCLCNESRTWELGGEGPLLPLSGGDVRLALGAGYRINRFEHRSRRTGELAIQADEGARFAYAEAEIPLATGTAGQGPLHRLSLTAALRSEDYDSFGRVTTPKVGVVFRPSATFTAKASWGRSFKAPTLFQLHQGQYSEYDSAAYYGGSMEEGDDMALLVGGGNADLEPERARTWTASLAIHPEPMPGLEIELAAFHIDYVDRVVQPIVNYTQVLNDPSLVRFVDRAASRAELERIVSTTRFFNYSGAPFDPDRVTAVIHGEYANVARQKIQGVDVAGSQRFELGSSRVTVRGSVAWLDSTQQVMSGMEPSDLSGMLFSPARINGRLGAVWDRGSLSASVFANHASGLTNPVDDHEGASFTTFDAVLRYASSSETGPWAGTSVTLTAQNLLDPEPPLYSPASSQFPPYDSTNFSAIGRFLGLSVAKHF